MHRLTFIAGVWLGAACTPASQSLGAGETGTTESSMTATSADPSSDASDEASSATDDGCDGALCCESVENPAAVCGAAATPQECESASVGDDWCFWVEWRTVSLDGLSCVEGDSTFECRHQGCSEEGCASIVGCPSAPGGVVVRSTESGVELGIGGWCFTPDGATDCRWDGDGVLVGGPPECACACGESVGLCDVEFDEYLAALGAASKMPPGDCGALTNDAPVADWQAAHDCALTAAAGGQAFIVSWEDNEGDVHGPEVVVRNGIVGAQGESYALAIVHGDVTADDTFIQQASCTALAATEDCTVAPQRLCITCVGQTASEMVCPEA